MANKERVERVLFMKQDQIELERSANCQWETGKGSLILDPDP